MPSRPLDIPGRPCTHLAVCDMKASIDFYVQELGFYYDHGLPQRAWLLRPELLLVLSPGTPARHLNGYWGWTVDGPEALKQLYARFVRRRLVVSELAGEDGADQHFVLYDPDAYPLVFSVDVMETPESAR